MLRIFVPLILLAAAIGLFVLYTNPTYQTVKDLRAQEADLDQALTKSKDLLTIRNSLIAKRNTFATADVQKVERMLPDNIDNIRLILDTQTVAKRYGLLVQNVAIQTAAKNPKGSAMAVGGTNSDPVGSVELSFAVSARYEDFLRFLKDLERSVRVVDIEQISFENGKGDLTTYAILIKTYWLR